MVSKAGNSLLEYALPLIVLFAGTLYVTFAMDVPQRLVAFFASSSNATQNGSSLLVAPLGSAVASGTAPQSPLPAQPQVASAPSPVQPSASGASQVQMTVTLASGHKVTLPYPANLKNSVETAGANGTTSALVSGLEQMIQQMEAAEEIDAAQASSLQKLANQGHRIALIEKTIEDFSKTSPHGAGTMESASIPFEGKNYHKDDLSQKVESGGKEMEAFHDLYRNAISDGALNDPAIRTVVSQMVSHINAVGDAFADAVWMADTSREITKDTASELTDYDSKGICKSGGGRDSGVQCS